MDNFNKQNDYLYDPQFPMPHHDIEKLDMYGVWLKKKKDPLDGHEHADNEDVQIAESFDDDDFSFSDSFSDIDNGIDIPELDDFNTDTSLSAKTLPEPPVLQDKNNPSDEALDKNTFNSLDSFESLDLDDFLSDDSPVASVQQETADSFIGEEPINLDFSEMTNDTAKPAVMDDQLELTDLTDTALAHSEQNSRATADSPSDITGAFETVDDFNDILSDDNSAAQKPPHTSQPDSPALDMHIAADDEEVKIQPLPELSAPTEEDGNISLFGTDNPKAESTAPDHGNYDKDDNFFDDIEAIQQDLLSPHPAAEQDKTTELLLKIAEEVNTLKAELNSLKASIASQLQNSAGAPIKDLAANQNEEAAHAKSSGFFSDDDTDETIALTGDELNNILMAADFTEGTESEKKDSTDTDTHHLSEQAEDFEAPPAFTDDADKGVALPDDHTFEQSISEPLSANTLSEDVPETKGEKLLDSDPVFNIEAAPITSLPEDFSYLDEQSENEEGYHLNSNIDTPEEPYLENIEEAEPADDINSFDNFDNIDMDSFVIPAEQTIAVPPYEEQTDTEKTPTAALSVEEPTIHELQNDADFPDPFAAAPQTGESNLVNDEKPKSAFIGVSDTEIDNESEEDTVEELDEIPDWKSHIDSSAKPKQNTLLQAAQDKRQSAPISPELKNEIKSVLAYMDQLLEALPEQKIEEFAKSEHFEKYKHLFEELGIS